MVVYGHVMILDVDLINRGPRVFSDSFKIVSFTVWLDWWYQVIQEFIGSLVRCPAFHRSHPDTLFISILPGLALYRALLRQCSPSTGNPPWLAETQSLVKQRFRRYRQLQSPSQAANALKAGYKVRLP